MNGVTEKARIPDLLDRILLCMALAAGILATLRSFGTGKVTGPAVVLLASAILLSIRPLAVLVRGGGGSSRWKGHVLSVIFGTHLIATLFVFTPEDLLNSRPVISLDHSIHYQQVVRAREVFVDSYRLHTYDPYFMAGYPGGTVFDIDSKGVELWCVFMGFIGTARAFKLFIFLGYLLLPFSIFAGSRRLGFNFNESILSTLVLLAFWHWGRPYVGEFRFAGMFSCLIVSHLSVYIMGLFRSFLRLKEARAFWVAGPLAFLVHPTTTVLLPVPFIALFIVERRRVASGKAHGKWELKVLSRLIIWCLLVLAVNAIWLVPLFKYLDIKVSSETFFQIDGISGLIDILVKPGNLPALLLVALSVAGFIDLFRSGRAGDTAGPAAGSLFLLIIAAFGIYLPVFDQMEPGRFLVPALILMSPLAGAGLLMLHAGIKRVVSSKTLVRRAGTAALIILLMSSPAFSLLSSRSWYRHILSTTLPGEVDELIEALQKYTGPSGRLMIEDGPAWNYGDSFVPAIIPQFTGVEQIGGPYPWTFIKHNFTNFIMCSAMGRPLKEMGEKTLRQYMDLYNIRWVLTSTPDCREFFEGIMDSPPVWDSRHFSLWALNVPGNSLEERGITVIASYDRISVVIKADEGGRLPEKVLLPYHWDPGLRVDPPAVLSSELKLEDPVPFILLEPNGKSEILIEFR